MRLIFFAFWKISATNLRILWRHLPTEMNKHHIFAPTAGARCNFGSLDLPQSLHGDSARRDHQKMGIIF